MNQEQNNLNQNNFNMQGNNGMQNNQPLNNQSFNNTFNPNVGQSTSVNQSAPNFVQTEVQQTTPQPINTFESNNTNNPNFNTYQQSGIPPKKKKNSKIFILIAIVAVVVVGVIILLSQNKSIKNNEESFFNNQPDLAIENYEVDLEELVFSKKQAISDVVQNLYCNITINEKIYTNLFLTKNGGLYLLSENGKSFIKIAEKTKLKYVDGLIEYKSNSNPLIYGNGIYYSLSENGDLEEFDGRNIIYPINIAEDNNWAGITADKKFTALLSCADFDKYNASGVCNDTTDWITLKSDMKFKFASHTMLLSSENKLYSASEVFLNFMNGEKDYKGKTINISQMDLNPILENIENYYEFNFYANGNNGNSTLFQTADNKVYIYNDNLLFINSLLKLEPDVLEFEERIKKIYGSGRFEILVSTDKTIYLLKIMCENLTECKWGTIDLNYKLNEYKDKIRSFGSYDIGAKYFVLLTNGKLYKLDLE